VDPAEGSSPTVTSIGATIRRPPGIRPARRINLHGSSELEIRVDDVAVAIVAERLPPLPLSSQRDSCKIEPGGIAGARSAMQRSPHPDLVEVTR
jgi:hypothetical protein